jgi:hypothetical protein
VNVNRRGFFGSIAAGVTSLVAARAVTAQPEPKPEGPGFAIVSGRFEDGVMVAVKVRCDCGSTYWLDADCNHVKCGCGRSTSSGSFGTSEPDGSGFYNHCDCGIEHWAPGSTHASDCAVNMRND